MARRALIIANGSFEDSRIAPLRSPIDDAERLKALFENEKVGGYETKICPNSTAQTIRLEIEKFFRNAKKDDRLILFLSGHGLLDEQRRIFFPGYDTNKDFLSSTAVSAAYITEHGGKTTAGSCVLFIDTCYSGAFAPGVNYKAGTLEIDRHDFSQLEGRGMAIITASSSVQLASEAKVDGVFQSHFTRYLIEGIETGKADQHNTGFITLDSLFSYINDRLKSAVPWQTPKPYYYGLSGSEQIALNPHWVPARLPEDLLEELRSPDRKSRGLAAERLAEIVRDDAKCAQLARQELEKLRKDDSYFVRSLAEENLRVLDKEQGLATVGNLKPRVQAVKPDAKADAIAAKLRQEQLEAEAQRLQQLKAIAEQEERDRLAAIAQEAEAKRAADAAEKRRLRNEARAADQARAKVRAAARQKLWADMRKYVTRLNALFLLFLPVVVVTLAIYFEMQSESPTPQSLISTSPPKVAAPINNLAAPSWILAKWGIDGDCTDPVTISATDAGINLKFGSDDGPERIIAPVTQTLVTTDQATYSVKKPSVPSNPDFMEMTTNDKKSKMSFTKCR